MYFANYCIIPLNVLYCVTSFKILIRCTLPGVGFFLFLIGKLGCHLQVTGTFVV